MRLLWLALLLVTFLIGEFGCSAASNGLPQVRVGMSDTQVEYLCEEKFPQFLPAGLRLASDGTQIKVYRQEQLAGIGCLYLIVHFDADGYVTSYVYEGY